MYVGGVPLYPSLPTGDGPQSKGMWQCGALPLMPLWQQPPVGGGGGGQEASKADTKTPGAPTGAATDNIADDTSRKVRVLALCLFASSILGLCVKYA